jgi:hypothetical protein
MKKTRLNQEDDSIKFIGFTDVREKLSTLWIFVMFNYLYADVIGLMKAETLQELITGYAGSMQITEGFLLSAAVLMETAIAMVLLSRILSYRANRWANIMVAVIFFAINVIGLPTYPQAFDKFLNIVGLGFNLITIWYAWNWV